MQFIWANYTIFPTVNSVGEYYFMPRFDLLHENISKSLGLEIDIETFAPFYDLFIEKKVGKKYLLTEEGTVSQYLYFINQGAAYIYYLNAASEITVMQFGLEGYWITDMYSFLTGKTGVYNIETLEPCDLLCIERLFRILTQNAFIAQQNRIAKTNSESAEHRYLEFSKLYPHFIQRIPQYLIASYLGIKPQSLSRIRHQLSKK